MTMPGLAERDALYPAVALFRSLADPARLAIVRRLAEREARVVDLTAGAGQGAGLIGLALNAAVGSWWADPAIELLVAPGVACVVA